MRMTSVRPAEPGPWWRSYRRELLSRDLLAGITVAAYMVPQVMGYAAIAGLPPITGLWASLLPLVVYALLGSSRQLSVGPESTTALMTATTWPPSPAVTPVNSPRPPLLSRSRLDWSASLAGCSERDTCRRCFPGRF